MEIYNEGKYLKLQCFFALSNASDVFWLKWQITRQHYGNLNDFLLNNNNNNFWQPQKILWQNVLAKLIRIVYVSKHSNICISRNKQLPIHWWFIIHLLILQIHLCQRAMTCDELAALCNKGNFTASIRNKRNNSAWALAGNVDNPEEMWCRQNSSSMRKVKSAENLSNPRIIVNR